MSESDGWISFDVREARRTSASAQLVSEEIYHRPASHLFRFVRGTTKLPHASSSVAPR